MITKDEERAMLAKIKKIIDEAGPDSYIGLTFEGIIEQAEDNITSDFASNYKYMYETASKNVDAVKVQTAAAIKSLEDENKDLKEQIKTLTGTHEAKAAKIEELNKQLIKADEDWSELFNEREALKLENNNQKSEIIALKAKLYDLMTA